MFAELTAVLAVGFLGSLHCLGMCGPIVLAYSLRLKACAATGSCGDPVGWKDRFPHLAAFHLGRLATYGTLGAAAAGLLGIAGLSRLFSETRTSVMLLAGVLLLLTGGVLLRAIPLPAALTRFFEAQGAVSVRLIPRLLQSRAPFNGLALGLAAGLLPCCLSWAALISAAATENPFEGFLVMTAFWLGTLPALIFSGMAFSFLSPKVRLAGERAAALLIIASGLVLLSRGAGILA